MARATAKVKVLGRICDILQLPPEPVSLVPLTKEETELGKWYGIIPVLHRALALTG